MFKIETEASKITTANFVIKNYQDIEQMEEFLDQNPNCLADIEYKFDKSVSGFVEAGSLVIKARNIAKRRKNRIEKRLLGN